MIFVAKLYQAIKALRANHVDQAWQQPNSIWFKSIHSNSDGSDNTSVLYDSAFNGWINNLLEHFVRDFDGDNFSTTNIVRITEIT